MRRRIQGERKLLQYESRKAKEESIIAHLREHLQACGAKHMMGYISFGGEVDLAPLYDELQAAGGSLYLPRVRDKVQCVMDAVLMPVPWRRFIVSGAYGISEPDPSLPPAGMGDLKVILVPGVAYDRCGARIGFGGGYYDRFLPCLDEGVSLIGVAFGFQVIDLLQCEPHDVRVQFLCTEDGCVSADIQSISERKQDLE